MASLFRRLWRSERNPFAWQHTMSVFGNHMLSSHGEYYRHKYTGRRVFIPRFPNMQKKGP